MKKINLIFSVVMFSLANLGLAQTLYWDGGTVNITTNGDGISQGAAGTWDNSIQNWDQGAGLAHIAWPGGADAVFGATGIAAGAGVVTLGASITANSITVISTNYFFADGGVSANTLTLNAVTNTAAVTIGANVVNSAGFTLSGSSTLTLTNVSTGFTGPLTINGGGTLQLGDASAKNGPTGFGAVSVDTNATLLIRDATSTSYAQNISGQGSVYLNGKSSSVITTLSGANTYTNKTIVNQATLSVANVDETDPNCNIGTGPLQICNGSSATTFNYVYPGGDVTTARPLIFGGTSLNTAINNNSAGTLTLAGPVSFAGTTGAKNINLGGNETIVFASIIPDNITLTTTNLTTVQKNNIGSLMLTGSNTFSGGVTFLGGASGHNGILLITNDAGLGAASAVVNFKTNSTSGCDATIESATFPVTLGSSRTVKLNGSVGGYVITAKFQTTDTNSLTVASYITGIGNVQRASSSISLGAVRLSNDTNDFTGTNSTGYGTTEFTSVANGGSPSALGAGTSAYAIINSSSYANFNYVGSGSASTTRAIDWQGTSGGLGLGASGGGPVQYLATGNLKSGSGSSSLTLDGTNSGNNTLAQVINDSTGTTTLKKQDAGTWVLTGANTYGGTTTISGGTLSVSSDGNLGTAPGSATPNSLTLNGGALSASASFTLNANRGIALGNGTVDVASAQTLTYDGIMADLTTGGNLTKTSGGILTLSGANTYTGNTTISGGTLALSGSGTIGSGGNLSIVGGATFDVSGVGGYTLAASQSLQATAGATATINGSLDISSASVLMTNVVNTPTIAVTSGNLTLGGGEAFTVNLNNGGTPLGAGSYKLIASGAGGSVIGTAPASVTVGGDGIVGGGTSSLSISNNELYLVVSGGTLYPPTVNGFNLVGGAAVLSFSGTNGQTWKILTSTNLALPLTNWDTVITGTFAGSVVNYTNAAPVDPQRFYLITSP